MQQIPILSVLAQKLINQADTLMPLMLASGNLKTLRVFRKVVAVQVVGLVKILVPKVAIM